MDTTPRISNDQPTPPDVNRNRMDWTFLKDLQVGYAAHFDVDDEDELIRLRNNLSSAAHKYGRDLGRTFTVRIREDRTGLGVWRLE